MDASKEDFSSLFFRKTSKPRPEVTCEQQRVPLMIRPLGGPHKASLVHSKDCEETVVNYLCCRPDCCCQQTDIPMESGTCCKAFQRNGKMFLFGKKKEMCWPPAGGFNWILIWNRLFQLFNMSLCITCTPTSTPSMKNESCPEFFFK